MAKVLLATDPGPPRTRGLLRLFLETAGHQVREVSDGEAALAEVGAGGLEALVLDTALPSLDGFQVLARLQARDGAPRVPILVISTIPDQLGRQLVEYMGAARYLHKPFAFETLRVALDDVLALPGANGAAQARSSPAQNDHQAAAPRPLGEPAARPPRRTGRERSTG